MPSRRAHNIVGGLSGSGTAIASAERSEILSPFLGPLGSVGPGPAPLQPGPRLPSAAPPREHSAAPPSPARARVGRSG
jgi:hypothetical protein